MPEDTKTQGDVDEKGVPWSNRLKELERKFQEKYDKELEATRKELNDLKASMPQEEQPVVQEEEVAKADLMEFVKNPRGFVANTYRQSEFERQIPEAEAWIKKQPGYTKDDDASIFQIIKENKLDTPYHTPMQRATTAWNLLEAERLKKQISEKTDNQRREEAAKRAELEGTGKATSKEKTVTRMDIIKKLAEAEKVGDLDAAIKYTSLLEDIH